MQWVYGKLCLSATRWCAYSLSFCRCTFSVRRTCAAFPIALRIFFTKQYVAFALSRGAFLHAVFLFSRAIGVHFALRV